MKKIEIESDGQYEDFIAVQSLFEPGNRRERDGGFESENRRARLRDRIGLSRSARPFRLDGIEIGG